MAHPPEIFPGLKVNGFDSRGELLWDGDCRLCQTLALTCRVANRTYQQSLALLPEAVRRTAPDQMIWIEPDGTVYGGAEAWLHMLPHEGKGWVVPLIGNPLLRPVTRAVYRWVARHRQRLL